MHQLKIKKLFALVIGVSLGVAITVFIIIWLAAFTKTFSKVCTLKTDKHFAETQDIALQKALANIPEEKLFYYYSSDKMWLEKNKNECGVYFRLKGGDNNIQIWYTRELIIAPKNIEDKQNLFKILQTEKLEYVRDLVGGKNIVVKTTDQSLYVDSLQMSQYLRDKYPDLQYVDPNSLQIGKMY